jgi:dTDP-4-dehydrorhamnose reductase
MILRFAVVGENGMFGSEMLSVLKSKGLDAHGFGRLNLNLDSDAQSIANTLSGADVIINAVAYTAVDRAETEIEEANTVNGQYAGALADASAILGARFIHISTDYVFDGSSNSPYGLTAPTSPNSSYGRSKALGEELVAKSGADFSILRTAWLYGANGRCFPKVMAELLNKNGSVKVVGDQFGQPTWTRDLAEQVLKVLTLEKMPRVVHAVSSGQATWADFAKEVAITLGHSTESVTEISSLEYPTPAKRPTWSVLDNSSDEVSPIGDWRERWGIAAPNVLKEFI